MSKVRVYIDGKLVEMNSTEDLPVLISYRMEDPQDFQRKKSNESFGIVVPASLNNDRISNTFHNPSIEDLTPGQQYRSFRKALIEANGSELLVGKAALINAGHDTAPLDYEYDFYGGNGDWVIDLKELTLYDLLKHISFVFSKSNIQASWNFDGTDEDLPYVFAPVRYAQAMESGYKNYVENPPPFVDDWNMVPSYMKPSLSKYWILYWGFKSIGYRIQSDFLNTEYFRRQVMPWTWGNFLYSDGTKLDELKFLAKGTEEVNMLNTNFTGFWDVKASNDSTNGAFDNAGSYEYNQPASELKWTYLPSHDFGSLEATIYLSIAARAVATANSDVELRVKWFKNGVHVPHGNDNGNGNLLVDLDAPTVGRRTFTGQCEDWFSVTVNAGDIISAKIYLHTFKSGAGISRIHATVDEFKLDYFRIGLGGTINFENYNSFKNYKFIDFLAGVLDEFNISPQTDSTRKVVYLEPLHPYSLTNNLSATSGGYYNGHFLNWTEKQDLSKRSDLKLSSDSERELVFKYKDDASDGILKLIQDRNSNTAGSAKYVFPDRFKTGKKEIENRFFSPVVHYIVKQWVDLGMIAGAAPQMICLIPENVSNTSKDAAQNIFQPKSAYYKGLTTDVSWVFDGVKGLPFPFMFAVNYQAGGQNDPVLSYSDERIGPEGSEVIGKGLLRRFYLQRLSNMRNGQEYNTWFMLKNTDVQNFLHREHIVCRGQKWELVEITNYNPLSHASTNCFLRKSVPITAEDANSVFPSSGSVLNTGAPANNFDIKYARLIGLPSDIKG